MPELEIRRELLKIWLMFLLVSAVIFGLSRRPDADPQYVLVMPAPPAPPAPATATEAAYGPN